MEAREAVLLTTEEATDKPVPTTLRTALIPSVPVRPDIAPSLEFKREVNEATRDGDKEDNGEAYVGVDEDVP